MLKNYSKRAILKRTNFGGRFQMIGIIRNFLIVLLTLPLLICCQQAAEETPETSAEETAGTAGAEAAWNMKAEMVVVDSCPVACPCLFGGEGHGGQCRFVGAVHIVEGNHKGVSLDGVNWGLLGEFTGKSTAPQFGYSAYYVDSSATDEQKSALREILSGAPFSELGEQLGIQEASIKIDKPNGGKESYTLAIGDFGEYSVAPVYGNDPTIPQKVVNPVYPFPASEIIVGSATGKFSDHGKDLNLENNSGEISEFVLSGT
ncbi:DUF1326 domain-containing protein [Acidobacteria bacterium AH-259-O06]|nr:DUF1326 domain-containing protein [Acidobacteria bacterium AH-259-O06]